MKLHFPFWLTVLVAVFSVRLGAQTNYTTPYAFSTFAGLATPQFDGPRGVAVDGSGNLYVVNTDGCTIYKISPAGVVSQLAGESGSPGSQDGVGSAARFYFPEAIAVDGASNVYVADTHNCTVRKITAAGVVSTLAGRAGESGSADGAGDTARFGFAGGVAVDSAGNVYVADGDTIRKITPGGVVSTMAGQAGSVGTADGAGSAARFSGAQGLAVDSAGTIYVGDGSRLRKITASGVVSTLAELPDSATGVAVDSAGNVYVAAEYRDVIFKVTADGVVSTLAGQAGVEGSADGRGTAAQFWDPSGVAVDGVGNVYVADEELSRIRKITPDGMVRTFPFATDGNGAAARFAWPAGVAMDNGGNTYVADARSNTIRKITAAGAVSTYAGVAYVPGSTDGPTGDALFDTPVGVAVDNAGNVYVADGENCTIRKISPSGVVGTLAGLAGAPGSADGTGSAARFDHPIGVAVDGNGLVYVSDSSNHTIRKITPTGAVSTLAGLAGTTGTVDGYGSEARFNEPAGIVVDTTGNLYVADASNHAIRKITAAGTVSTVAGLPGTSGAVDGNGSAARFGEPAGIALDTAGNLYVAEIGNATIRKITAAGVVSTVAGLAGALDSVDGTGRDARFGWPWGIAVDGTGRVYVADFYYSVIRKGVSASAPLTIVEPPANSSVAPGASVTFAVRASGSGALSYQWSKDGVPIAGANSATLTLQSVTAADAGEYTIVISDGNGGSVRSSATLSVTNSTARLVNISSRAYCGTGNSVTIGGFVVVGNAAKQYLIRAVGPTLTSQGIGQSEVLVDPMIEVHKGSATIATNDNWGDNGNGALVSATGARVGATPIASDDTTSSALVVSLTRGVYTFIAKGKNDGAGIVLLEVYDAEADNTLARFVNISSRVYATTGNGVAIGGFVVAGRGAKRILMRAVGPTLATQGISPAEALLDPTIELHKGGATIATNNNWNDNSNADEIVQTGARIGATPIAASDNTSSALLMTLDPGIYTFIAKGRNDTSGIVLVEVYDAD